MIIEGWLDSPLLEKVVAEPNLCQVSLVLICSVDLFYRIEFF